MQERVVPIIKIYDCLVVPIQIELDDTTVEKIQKQILSEIENNDVKGVIIDVSMVDIIDSYISYTLSETATMARMMGCYTVLCGIQPQVALTLAQMGVNIKGIYYAMNLENALEILAGIEE
ncbi:STAS domain-containing protein [Thermosyntropha sp.]|uniref:STAS domain-containing protein n=1 Tax=Thermosyntropha sp. TaxID=2740820 RepID=UPI0025FC4965|nr:STAS domain-containing protein [Thermosyntropha sp.]MBO8158546.1 STAS domain-containing protein [Thermosyntropha sp.]